MARQYALPENTSRSDPRGKAAYIRETARKYGIDPEVALKVAKSEGLSTFQSSVVKNGTREPSWGAFQLYTGGGLGNKFQKETGLDPKDPKNEDATIDFALREAARGGWGPWYGAAKVGVGKWDGIGGAGAQAASAGAEPATTDASDKVKGTGTSTAAPDIAPNTPAAASGGDTGDILGKLKDPRGNASVGLGEAISGLGQAIGGTDPGKDLYAATPARPLVIPPPAVPTPPGVVPIVDPRAAENQRRQLALAMQRLNSGRLV